MIPALAVDHNEPKASPEEEADLVGLPKDAEFAESEPGRGCVGATDTEVK